MKKLVIIIGMVSCLVGFAPSAKAVDQWVWFSYPYAYFLTENQWGYFNQSDIQWCHDNGPDAQWTRLGQNALYYGWAYMSYPYVYSLSTAYWFYLNEADTQWVYYYGSGVWRRLGEAPAPPAGMVSIPVGINSGIDPVVGAYVLTNAYSLFMDMYPVTKAKWDEVYNWGGANGYGFEHPGSGKATNHPVQTVSLYDCVKWCNARSEKEGKPVCYRVGGSVYRTGRNDAVTCDLSVAGYRLPTHVEQQYAARGGLSAQMFPWGGATIDHTKANYAGDPNGFPWDKGYMGYDTRYSSGGYPYTSPVGSFSPNGYGLYDMAGNVKEWGWDLNSVYFSRIWGGSWYNDCYLCLVACGIDMSPFYAGNDVGFRSVLPLGQ